MCDNNCGKVKQKLLISETKITKKVGFKYGKLSSFVLGTLIVFSGVFFGTSWVRAATLLAKPVMTQESAGFGQTTYIFTLYENNKVVDPTNCNGCTIKWFATVKDTRVETTDSTNVNPYKLTQLSILPVPPIDADIIRPDGQGGTTTSSTKKPDTATGELNGIGGFVSTVVNFIVLMITEFLYGVTYYLLLPVIQVILSMKVHDSSFSAVILNGWVFVRNVMNIFFILAMLVIGLATLFRVDEGKYNYKHLLPELVLMALAINFSLVIAQLILGIADTLQAQFLPNNKEVMANLAYQLMVRPNQNLSLAPFQGNFSLVVSSLFYLFFAVASFMAFAALAAFLAIRVVGLWILLLLSPVAYGLRVLPMTHHYASEWWSNFLKYAFFTPIIGFFLHIIAALTLAQSQYLAQVTQNQIATNSSQNFGTFIANSLSNVMVLFFLFMAVEIARKISPKAAQGVISWAEHNTIKPFKLAGEGAQFVGGASRDYALRKKNETVDKLVRDDKGNLRGAGSRLAASILTPKMTVHNIIEEGNKKNKKAEELAKTQVETMYEHATTGGVVDNKADIKLKAKRRDEELGRVLKDSPKKADEEIQKLRMGPASSHKNEEIELRVEALAKTGKIEAVIRNRNGGAFNRNLIIQYAAQAANGDTHLEEQILKKIAMAAKNNGLLAGVALDKPGLTPTQLDREIADVVSNFEPTEIRKLNTSGIDPTITPDTTRAMQNLHRNSGVRDENLADKQQEYLGIGRYDPAHPTGPATGPGTPP